MAKKPLLFSEDFASNPDSRFDPEFWEGRAADPSWVPGYSEIVQANDLAVADDLDFRNAMREAGGKFKSKEDVYAMIGASPQQLPVELAWLPVSGPNGEGLSADARRHLEAYQNRQGFRLATKEDLDAHGYGTTVAMRVAEDGTIRRGPDTALYIRSGEVARKWSAHKQKKAAEAEGSTFDPELTDGAYAAPTFESEERSVERIAHK